MRDGMVSEKSGRARGRGRHVFHKRSRADSATPDRLGPGRWRLWGKGCGLDIKNISGSGFAGDPARFPQTDHEERLKYTYEQTQ